MANKGKQKIAVAKVGEIAVGDRKLVDVDGKSIGIFNVHGDHVAVLNVCPHQLAPICLGRVAGTTFASTPGEPLKWGRDGEILACPWHGWEFDLKTGEALADKRGLRKYPVTVEGERVYIEV
jgi:nitrite reductase/ring-hydroxylating ferredoxin subunit